MYFGFALARPQPREYHSHLLSAPLLALAGHWFAVLATSSFSTDGPGLLLLFGPRDNELVGSFVRPLQIFMVIAADSYLQQVPVPPRQVCAR
jgi:hypothetical protein